MRPNFQFIQGILTSSSAQRSPLRCGRVDDGRALRDIPQGRIFRHRIRWPVTQGDLKVFRNRDPHHLESPAFCPNRDNSASWCVVHERSIHSWTGTCIGILGFLDAQSRWWDHRRPVLRGLQEGGSCNLWRYLIDTSGRLTRTAIQMLGSSFWIVSSSWKSFAALNGLGIWDQWKWLRHLHCLTAHACTQQ